MNEQKREKETLKKQKKIIVIVMVSLVAFAILYFLISMIDFESLFKKEPVSDGKDTVYIQFADEELSKYPSEDEWYMDEAIKSVEYVHGSGTVFFETLLNENDAMSKGKPVLLLYRLIDYIKAGDHEGYNSCFSSYYFETSPLQGKFTKQKIYDITITEIKSETKSADGVVFTEYTYTLQYKIRHNNGTLRKDVGSDQIRTQYINISERSGEGFLIDRIYTLNDTIIS